MEEIEKKLGEFGIDASAIRARSQTRSRKRKLDESIADTIVREESRAGSVTPVNIEDRKIAKVNGRFCCSSSGHIFPVTDEIWIMLYACR